MLAHVDCRWANDIPTRVPPIPLGLSSRCKLHLGPGNGIRRALQDPARQNLIEPAPAVSVTAAEDKKEWKPRALRWQLHSRRHDREGGITRVDRHFDDTTQPPEGTLPSANLLIGQPTGMIRPNIAAVPDNALSQRLKQRY